MHTFFRNSPIKKALNVHEKKMKLLNLIKCVRNNYKIIINILESSSKEIISLSITLEKDDDYD